MRCQGMNERSGMRTNPGRRRNIPSGPINNYEQVFADPHIRARGLIVETEHPTLGRIRTLGPPVKMSETPAVTGRRAPLLGEHTTEILEELGIEN